jgi:hypothetical protein
MEVSRVISGACLLTIFLTAFGQNAAEAAEGAETLTSGERAMITTQTVNVYRESYLQLLDLEKARRRTFCQTVSDQCSTRKVWQDQFLRTYLGYETCTEDVRRKEHLSKQIECLSESKYFEYRNKILRGLRSLGASDLEIELLLSAARKKEDTWLNPLNAFDMLNGH